MTGNNGNGHHRDNGKDGNIPFLDLVTPHRQLEEELTSVFKHALGTAAIHRRPTCRSLRKGFRTILRYPALRWSGEWHRCPQICPDAAGVKAGDAVVTVPNTFIATTEAITQAGAHPEFVDVDENTHNMDPEKVREFIETKCEVDGDTGQAVTRKARRRVTAIVPVHLFGQPGDMDPIQELADRYHLMVVEDACQAHGSEYFSKKEDRWKRAGSMGCMAAFSFYPGKNLGACGEAGAVTTNDESLAHKIRMLRDHGQSRKYHHEIEGYNGRLDAIQARILDVKLAYLDQWNQRRRDNASLYRKLLGGFGEAVVVCTAAPWAKSNYHLYVVRIPDRDQLIAKRRAKALGRESTIPFPSICSMLTGIWDTKKEISRFRSDWPKKYCRCRCTRISWPNNNIVWSTAYGNF